MTEKVYMKMGRQYYFARAGALAFGALCVLIVLLVTQQWLAALMLFVGWQFGYLYHEYARQGAMRT